MGGGGSRRGQDALGGRPSARCSSSRAGARPPASAGRRRPNALNWGRRSSRKTSSGGGGGVSRSRPSQQVCRAQKLLRSDCNRAALLRNTRRARRRHGEPPERRFVRAANLLLRVDKLSRRRRHVSTANKCKLTHKLFCAQPPPPTRKKPNARRLAFCAAAVYCHTRSHTRHSDTILSGVTFAPLAKVT